MGVAAFVRSLGKFVLTLVLVVVGIVLWGIYQTWNVHRWDARIDALCAEDGGRNVRARVYEAVMAPETKEYFSSREAPRSLYVPERVEGQMLGPQYPYVVETRVVEILSSSNPSVRKFASRIIRTSDNKVLGERFGYQRSGGGVPGIDPGEIRTCPKLTAKGRLEVQVFANHPQRIKDDK